MAGDITAGSTAKASDFINNSERDATASNDAGKVVKLESDAKIHPNFIKNLGADVLVGEDIDGSTTPKACFVSDGSIDTTDIVDVGGAGGTPYLTLDPNEAAGGIVDIGEYDYITQFSWANAFTDNIDANDTISGEIFAVDGSNVPTGSALAVKTQTHGDGYTFIFDTPLAVTRNTVYVFVVRNQASNAGEKIGPSLDNSNQGSSFVDGAIHYTGGSWSSPTTQYPAGFTLRGYQTLIANKIYKSDKNITQRNFFDGFISDNLSTDDNSVLFCDVINGFTGLTGGSTYYVDSDGAIDTRGSREVGKAVSTTSIKIKR